MEATTELNFLSTLLPMVLVIFVIAIGVVLLNQQFQKNLYRQQLLQEELKSQHQQELLRSSIEIQETERKRIARDIHDELGALLSITRMHLVQMEQQEGGAGENQSITLQHVRHLTENAIASMRRISHELMPLQLEKFGLVQTLEALTNHTETTGKIHIQIKTDEDLPELNWPVKLGLYRIILEMVNNTLKHAEATAIQIDFSAKDEQVICLYTDNGKGISANHSGGGLGLKSIEGRTSALGGSVEIGNKSHKGFYGLIKIPLAN